MPCDEFFTILSTILSNRKKKHLAAQLHLPSIPSQRNLPFALVEWISVLNAFFSMCTLFPLAPTKYMLDFKETNLESIMEMKAKAGDK